MQLSNPVFKFELPKPKPVCHPELLALKHTSRILGHSSNPICGFFIMETVRLCAVWPRENWLGSSLNQIQGWTTVRESYSRALEQGPLLSSFPLPGFSSQLLHEAVRGPRGAGPAGGHARPAVARVLHRDHPAGVAIGG